jgi:hypothetical protein
MLPAELEVIWPRSMGRGRHQQVMVGHPGKRLAQPVGIGLAVLARGAHFVGFIHDHQLPARPQQAFAGVLDQ